MYISDLMLRDFGAGVFQDARMGAIDDGLVVVGGPQRSGKTTLLHAIRRLGFGIEKGANIPPPVDEYNVRANVQFGGHEYVLKVKGYRDPTLISTGTGPDVSISELYGGVSKRQYQQLFTITLDELKRVPSTVDDAEALSEVLLGAAYGDVAVIPQMESAFADRAYQIGRSFGKPTQNSELRGPMDTIEAGISKRDDAIDQVAEWGATREELEEVVSQIDELATNVQEATHQKERLAVLADEFEALHEYQELRDGLEREEIEKAQSMPEDALSRAESLKEEFDQEVSRREELRDELFQQAPDGDANRYMDALLEHRELLIEHEHQRAKWESQVERVSEEAETLRREQVVLESRVSEIYEDWEGEFDPVLDIQTDSISTGEVRSAVEDFKKTKSDLQEAETELGEATRRLQKHEEQLRGEPENDHTSHNRELLAKTGTIGIASVAIGVGGAIAGFPIVGGVTGSVLLIVGLYAVLGGEYMTSVGVDTTRELKNAINAAQAEIEGIERRREEARKRKESAEEQLASLKEELGLPETVQPDSVLEFYERVEDCKSDILSLQQSRSDLAEDRDALTSELGEAATTIARVRSYSWNKSRSLSEADELFRQLELTASDLELAQSLEEIETNIRGIEGSFAELCASWGAVADIDPSGLNSTQIDERLSTFISEAKSAESVLEQLEHRDRTEERLEDKLQTGSTRTAFDVTRPAEERRLDVLERMAQEYESGQEVREQLSAVSEELTQLEADLEGKKKEEVKLEEKLDSLKSDDEIVVARQQISEGREELRRLGEEYAVNRIAQYLTERLHERFIEEVAGPLIDDASRIFHRITREYEGIDHNEQFEDLDFEALREGKSPHGSDELSRATAEQLFLAIRLARIRQLDVSLPIVIDDALTNFDPAHGARTLRTVAELAESNQVFLLTCHPEAVMLAESYGGGAQYWGLDDGRFDGPHGRSDPVYELLNTEGVSEGPEQPS